MSHHIGVIFTTRMRSNRMRTARSSNRPGGLHQETPLGADSPGSRPPLLQGMLGYHLQCLMGYHPPMNRMTVRCKNITLPQTSFAGGNDKRYLPTAREGYVFRSLCQSFCSLERGGRPFPFGGQAPHPIINT